MKQQLAFTIYQQAASIILQFKKIMPQQIDSMGLLNSAITNGEIFVKLTQKENP